MSDDDKIIPFSKDEETTEGQPRSARLDALAAHLTESLEERQPIYGIGKRVLICTFLSLAYIAVLISLSVPLRSDAHSAIIETSLSFDIVISLLMGASAMYASVRLMVPLDKQQAMRIILAPFVLLFAFGVWSAFRTFTDMTDHHHHHQDLSFYFEFRDCFWQGMLFIVLPSALLIYLAKRSASTNPVLLHSMSLLTVFSLGWVCLRLTCGLDHAAHSFIYHFLPFILIGVVSGFLSRFLFRSI